MKPSLAGLLGVLALAAQAAVFAEPPRLFYVQVAPLAAGTPVRPGLPLPHLTVTLRNDTSDKAVGVIPPQALVLRGVEWVGDGPDSRRWNGPIVGAATENSDGAVTVNPNAARLTPLSFERGLLLPGDELTLKLPTTPQGEGPLQLRIRYVLVGDSSQWPATVLLPADDTATTRFVPATEKLVIARHNRGGLGALRSTLSPSAAPLAEAELIVPVELPTTDDPTYQLTGGISIIESARRAGTDEAGGPWRGVFSAPLRTWFFVNARGAALAVERVPVAHPTIPPTAPPGYVPKPWKWTPRSLPAMDLRTPDEFGQRAGGGTSMRLDPATFGSIVTAAEANARTGRPGGVVVPPEKFWPVMDCAQAGQFRLRFTPPSAETDDAPPTLAFEHESAPPAK